MFTGIVEEMGTVRAVEPVGDGCRLVVGAATVLGDVTMGASIAVNGCCLTVTGFGDDDGPWFSADAVPETLARTTLGAASAGDPVNLERSMAADGRFGGHVVQGHVDTVTEVVAVSEHDDGSRRLTFEVPPALAGQIVEKGSVALDGVSLTVADLAVDGAAATFDIAVVFAEHRFYGHSLPYGTVNASFASTVLVGTDCVDVEYTCLEGTASETISPTLEAERSRHRVGGAQVETASEKAQALQRGDVANPSAS